MTFRAPVVGLVAALLVVTAACTGDDDGPAAPSPEEQAREAMAAACTEVVNERDAGVSEAGLGASTEVALRAVSGDDEVTAAEADALAADMAALRDALVEGRDRLADLDVSPDREDDWEVVVAEVDARAAGLDGRIGAITASDVGVALELLDRAPAPSEEFAAAIEELGLTGRDCEVVADHPGVPEAHAGFVAAAASACSAVVGRRQAGTFDADTVTVIDAVALRFEGEEVTASDDLLGALDRLAEEWEATEADFAAVPTDDAPDAAGWEQAVRLARDRVDAYERRARVLRNRDNEAALDEAWSTEALGEVGFDGFGPNALDRRDCRSVQA